LDALIRSLFFAFTFVITYPIFSLKYALTPFVS
jgi:hypothetical protein